MTLYSQTFSQTVKGFITMSIYSEIEKYYLCQWNEYEFWFSDSILCRYNRPAATVLAIKKGTVTHALTLSGGDMDDSWFLLDKIVEDIGHSNK